MKSPTTPPPNYAAITGKRGNATIVYVATEDAYEVFVSDRKTKMFKIPFMFPRSNSNNWQTFMNAAAWATKEVRAW